MCPRDKQGNNSERMEKEKSITEEGAVSSLHGAEVRGWNNAGLNIHS